jgi:hypothetical protein
MMMMSEKWATGLGVVSIALGLTEVVAPGLLARTLGLRSAGLVRAFGAREIAAGVGLLSRARKGPWVGARIAGDALDLAVLASAALRATNSKKRNVAIAIAAVTPIVLTDLVYGRQLMQA